MTQEFIITRCYSCQTFQVHQIRKDSRFVCKVCGQKQSKRKIYGKGSAMDCRKAVQQLNMQSCDRDEDIEYDLVNQVLPTADQKHFASASLNKKPKASKWDDYIDDDREESDPEQSSPTIPTSSLSVTSKGENSSEMTKKSSVKRLHTGEVKLRSEHQFVGHESTNRNEENPVLNKASSMYKKYESLEEDFLDSVSF